MRWSILLILAGLCLEFYPIRPLDAAPLAESTVDAAQLSAAQLNAVQLAESQSGINPTGSATVGTAQPGVAQPNVAQSDILQQPITLSYQEATLPQILRSIHDQYQIKFAYLNNEMPEDHTFSIQAEAQPLRWVLNELLRDTGLSYQLVNQQIVIRKDVNQTPTPPPAQPKPVRSGEASHPSSRQDQSQEMPLPPIPSSEEASKLTAAVPVQDNRAIHPSSPTVVAQLPVTIISDTTKY